MNTGSATWESERIDRLARELKSALEEAASLRAELARVQTHAEGVWFWQGKGDAPESLSCPVVMSAGSLRAMLGVIEKAKEMARMWHVGPNMRGAVQSFEQAIIRHEGP